MKQSDYLTELNEKIKGRLLEDKRIVILIDGRAASGKTTAALRLAKEYDGYVIHMDDFFLPYPMRTEERLKEPGGNVHYERVWEQVYLPLLQEKEFSYDIFDCHAGSFSGKREISAAAVILIEGAYCMHPYFKKKFKESVSSGTVAFNHELSCINVFFDVADQKQRERILNRNGAEMLKLFEECFIPMEDRYFKFFSVKERADLIIAT